MAKILLTAGPIPAKVDSVKFITNRFKGGLALKTARMLQSYYGHQVTVVKWKHCDLKDDRLRFINVDDVNDYIEKVLDIEADMYILSAAVANLTPSNPWTSKFPSHNYKVGEKFNIEFEIAPRLIDQIKLKYPRSSLVGYKLFDGAYEKLIEAGIKTLVKSKANLVFANTPSGAKNIKYALTQDFAEIPVDFDEHIALINKLAISKFYKTKISNYNYTKYNRDPINNFLISSSSYKILSALPRYKKMGRTFGCFAFPTAGNMGFITTSRGKKDLGLSFVSGMQVSGQIVANRKATLNAPLLAELKSKIECHSNFIVHGHKQIPNQITFDYEFPGTDREADLARQFVHKRGHTNNIFNIRHHGYIAMFGHINDCMNWLKENES